jgi:heme exporter protein A
MLCGYRLSAVRGSKVLFRDVSFSLHRGGALLLLGKNGAGKTTLLEMIAGFNQPSCGILTWEGERITRELRLDKGRLRAHWVDCRSDGIQERTRGSGCWAVGSGP